ncbi:MAG: efflux RND transporter periplasmic adaptor subunit [Candidatus Woesebacteria bacterium]
MKKLKRAAKRIKNLPKKIIKTIKKRWKLLLVLILIISALAFFLYKRQEANKIILTFEKPQREDITETLEVSGIIDAKEKATLRFIAGGKVTYLGVQEGDYVKKWQTIVIIDQRDLQKKLQQDLNDYMKERWDWDQVLDDTKDRWIPKSEEREKDKSQWDLDNTVLDVEIRDIAISNTVMSAPFSGIIVKSPTSTANVQLLATDTFELINPETLVFRAQVDEADIAAVSLDQIAKLTFDAYPDENITTQVNYIAYKSSQASSGTVFEIEFPILEENAATKYRLGMNGDAEIKLRSKENVLTIPLIATRERNGETFVDLKTGEETYEERKIEIGLETEDKVEVIDGLTENDEILIPE